jgi:uncharacterized protein (UPF0261 family)
MSSNEKVLIVSTLDTKAEETRFLKECLEARDVAVLLLDAGIRGESPIPADITRHEVALAAGRTLDDVRRLGHEGKALGVMTSGAVQCAGKLFKAGKIRGLMGLGGSMGTTLGTGVMRTFPIGFPKLMISTMASRNTRAFVGTKDIMMLHSVADLAGLNRITRMILMQGASAMAGMVKGDEIPLPAPRPLAIVSTLGTTEACLVRLRHALEDSGLEVVTFHTNGSGGEALEDLVRTEDVAVVLDLSLHEVMDHFFGGDYDAGPERGAAALERGIPTILVPGNTDFLVTGPLETAADRFSGRRMHAHNDAITVVSTSREEMAHLANWISDACRQARGPVAVVVPMGGFSAFDAPGGPLENPEARHTFQKELKARLPRDTPCVFSQHHINDAQFAREILDAVKHIAGLDASAG